MNDIEINLDGDQFGQTGTKSDPEKNFKSQADARDSGASTTISATSADKPMLNLDQFNLKQSSHPLAALFHMVFKAVSMFLYLFGGWLFDGVTIFILICLLQAFDFWTVKNVSGRLLVGLRWWTVVDENGNENWMFESHDHQSNNSSFDTYVFWWSQYTIVGFWAFFFTYKLITFSPFWGTLNFICLFLSGLNLYGYFKCNKQHRNKLKNAVNDISKKIFYKSVMSKIGF